MPWSQKQMRVAEAVKHGWKPKGSAKGFTHDFAEQVISEGVEHKPGTLGHLAGMKKKGKR